MINGLVCSDVQISYQLSCRDGIEPNNFGSCSVRVLQQWHWKHVSVVISYGLTVIEGLRERTEHLDIFFLPITQWCSISDVLFTGGRGVSDFSVLKYY